MEREWDNVDEQAAREGSAVHRMNEYSTREAPSPLVKLRRLFPDDVCSEIERMSPKEWRKLKNRTDIRF